MLFLFLILYNLIHNLIFRQNYLDVYQFHKFQVLKKYVLELKKYGNSISLT
jgi:hypothetical protein